jgi:hypothetical protein
MLPTQAKRRDGNGDFVLASLPDFAIPDRMSALMRTPMRELIRPIVPVCVSAWEQKWHEQQLRIRSRNLSRDHLRQSWRRLNDQATHRRASVGIDHNGTRYVRENTYLRNMDEGHRALLPRLYTIAQRVDAPRLAARPTSTASSPRSTLAWASQPASSRLARTLPSLGLSSFRGFSVCWLQMASLLSSLRFSVGSRWQSVHLRGLCCPMFSGGTAGFCSPVTLLDS